VQAELLADIRFTEKRHGYDPDEVDLFLRKVGVAVSELHTRVNDHDLDGPVTLGLSNDDFAAQLMTVRFSESKRGYDPDEVDNFLAVVAGQVGEIQTRLRATDAERQGPLVATLFRIALPVGDIDRAAVFYEKVFGMPGRRVAPTRHYFDCGGIILACFDAGTRTNGNGHSRDHAEHVCFSLRDLDAAYPRVQAAGPAWIEPDITTRPSGERSFYAKDPFGNPLCFVDETTVVTSSDLAG
jgi:DivIVA domain-containing protein